MIFTFSLFHFFTFDLSMCDFVNLPIVRLLKPIRDTIPKRQTERHPPLTLRASAKRTDTTGRRL